MNRVILVLLLSVIAGCTETITLTTNPLENLVAIEVSPADATITVTDLQPPADANHTLQYTAMGRYADGTMRDITPFVSWSTNQSRLGSIDKNGLFTASHQAAGLAMVTVTARELATTSPLTVIIDATIIDSAFPPPGPNLFDPANTIVLNDPTNAPRLIYPADSTTFPPDISRTLFQFDRGALNNAFRLTFDSEFLHLAVETGTDRWQTDTLTQRLIAVSGAAGKIRVEVQGTSSNGPGTIYVGNRVTLAFTSDSPGGPIYFWSAATNGIMRGGLELPAAGRLYPEQTSGTCVGCHAINRSGSLMAMGYDNTISVDLQTIELGGLSTQISASTARPMGWATWSPDNTRLLVANNGILTLYNAATGAAESTVPLPTMRYATHPDWSPDGTQVVVALTSQTPNNLDIRASSIAVIPYNNGAWGAPTVLVSGANNNNNYFPKWSPDGLFIAYVHATTTSQGAVSAELKLISGIGGPPRTLRLASRRVGPLDDVLDLSNTMPVWAPSPGERSWLAFVSARPYGAILPTKGRGQIWISALDLTTPGDPSSAAFWLPCQDVTVLNNNPAWSRDIITN